jgi:hypothetical protein
LDGFRWPQLFVSTMPATLRDERRIWHAVSRFIRESHPQLDWEGVDSFDRFRSPRPNPVPHG